MAEVIDPSVAAGHHRRRRSSAAATLRMTPFASSISTHGIIAHLEKRSASVRAARVGSVLVGRGTAPELHLHEAQVLLQAEGDAARVTEPGAVARIAKAWADNGWPAEPDESGSGITAPFNAPSQGPPPWHVYRIEPRSATVVSATEPGGLTRFRF